MFGKPVHSSTMESLQNKFQYLLWKLFARKRTMLRVPSKYLPLLPCLSAGLRPLVDYQVTLIYFSIFCCSPPLHLRSMGETLGPTTLPTIWGNLLVGTHRHLDWIPVILMGRMLKKPTWSTDRDFLVLPATFSPESQGGVQNHYEQALWVTPVQTKLWEVLS